MLCCAVLLAFSGLGWQFQFQGTDHPDDVVSSVYLPAAAEYLTGAIEAVSESSGINQAFLGLIVLPIAGNAAEHITVGGAGQGRAG